MHKRIYAKAMELEAEAATLMRVYKAAQEALPDDAGEATVAAVGDMLQAYLDISDDCAEVTAMAVVAAAQAGQPNPFPEMSKERYDAIMYCLCDVNPADWVEEVLGESGTM